jgi:hypothetical protein
MGSTLKIEQKNGMYALSGMIDETADFSSLLFAQPPLKLDMGGVLSINSTGLRAFLKFLEAWEPKEFEYHSCSNPIIHTFNILPSVLGEPPKVSRVISSAIPYACEKCSHEEEVVVATKDLVIDSDDEVSAPTQTCSQCHSTMSQDVDAGTYFLWLLDSDQNT